MKMRRAIQSTLIVLTMLFVQILSAVTAQASDHLVDEYYAWGHPDNTCIGGPAIVELTLLIDDNGYTEAGPMNWNSVKFGGTPRDGTISQPREGLTRLDGVNHRVFIWDIELGMLEHLNGALVMLSFTPGTKGPEKLPVLVRCHV